MGFRPFFCGLLREVSDHRLPDTDEGIVDFLPGNGREGAMTRNDDGLRGISRDQTADGVEQDRKVVGGIASSGRSAEEGVAEQKSAPGAVGHRSGGVAGGFRDLDLPSSLFEFPATLGG